MNGYERIIILMREQGAVKNPASLQLAEMTSATTCKIEDLKLEADDLLIAEHLTDYEIEIESEDDLEVPNMKIKVHGALKKGDLVLVQRMSDEQYIIIEKLAEVV